MLTHTDRRVLPPSRHRPGHALLRASCAILACAAFAVSGCGADPIPVKDPAVQSQPVRYTRHGIRGTTSGFHVTTYRSNYLGDPPLFRPGRKIQITLYSKERIDFLIDGSECRMFPGDFPFPTDPERIRATLEKHFAVTREELNLDAMAPETRKEVDEGEVTIGMTKEEVFAAVGYPSHIDDRLAAAPETRDRIFQSNVWIYRYGEVGPVYTSYRTYRFDERGKLVEVVR